MDGLPKRKAQGVKFGRKREVTPERAAEIKSLREAGSTVPEINVGPVSAKRDIYRALGQ